MRPVNKGVESREPGPEGADGQITLTLLDGFQLKRAGTPILLPLAAQRLLAFVAINERSLLRIYVAGKLWPETGEKFACASLRSALWRLLRCCEPAPVNASRTHLSLMPHVQVDVQAQLDAIRRLDRVSAGRLDAFVAILDGDLLPDWYDDWVFVERERLRQLRLHALESAAKWLTSIGRYGEAVQAALAALRADPLRETAHRLLVEAHLAEGNRMEAMRQWRLCRRVIWERFAAEPSFRWDDLCDAAPPITKSRSNRSAESVA